MGVARREKNKNSFCRLDRPRPFQQTIPEAPLEQAQNARQNVCQRVYLKMWQNNAHFDASMTCTPKQFLKVYVLFIFAFLFCVPTPLSTQVAPQWPKNTQDDKTNNPKTTQNTKVKEEHKCKITSCCLLHAS